MNEMFIILDTETTDKEPPYDFCEVAYRRYDCLKPLNQVCATALRYKPKYPISLGATATHHIFDEDLLDSPPSSMFVFPEVQYMIGHNIDFDWRVLGEPEVKRICTLAIARKLLPVLDSHTLTALAYHFYGTAVRDLVLKAHGAEADVEICEQVFVALLTLAEDSMGADFQTINDVYIFSEWCRVPDTMSFGKWKGTKIKEVPMDYVIWLLRQPELDPYLEKALRDTHNLIRGTR